MPSDPPPIRPRTLTTKNIGGEKLSTSEVVDRICDNLPAAKQKLSTDERGRKDNMAKYEMMQRNRKAGRNDCEF
jgi:hypothetical protein